MVVREHRSPQVHTRSRTIDSDHDRQRLIERARQAQRTGPNRLLPVYGHRGKLLAWVASSLSKSIAIEHEPWMLEHRDRWGRLFGMEGVDDVIEAVLAGRFKFTKWDKTIYNGGIATRRWMHLFGVAGQPGAADFGGAARTARLRSDATDYGIRHGGNVSPMRKHLVAIGMRLGTAITLGESASLILYDLVATYDQCDVSASSQNMNNGIPPDRYCGAGEPGLDIMVVSTGINGNRVYTSLTYTSDTGTAPEGAAALGSNLQTVFTSAVPGPGDPWISAIEMSGSLSVLTMPLRAGDQGVKQIDQYQMSGTDVGASIAFLLGRPLATIPVQNGDVYAHLDLVKQTGEAPVILDGACLTFAANNGSLGGQYGGHIMTTWKA